MGSLTDVFKSQEMLGSCRQLKGRRKKYNTWVGLKVVPSGKGEPRLLISSKKEHCILNIRKQRHYLPTPTASSVNHHYDCQTHLLVPLRARRKTRSILSFCSGSTIDVIRASRYIQLPHVHRSSSPSPISSISHSSHVLARYVHDYSCFESDSRS